MWLEPSQGRKTAAITTYMCVHLFLGVKMIEKELYKLIKKAIKRNEVPVAAIIVKNGKICYTFFVAREKVRLLV